MKEKYIPGEGCQCSARCSCECGCDVDWTPREVYELRDKAERYRLDANAMMMQRDRLAAVLQRIRDGYGGQVASPNCCEDCDYLLPIDEALAAVKGGKDDH
jgi:hypothetical protein